MYDLIVYNCSPIITFYGEYVRGNKLLEPIVIERGVIGCKDGKIAFVGDEKELKEKEAKEYIDAENNLVTPGLIDPHTHIVFGGTRSDEFILKIKGESYERIKELGGGINKTIALTKETSKQELKKRAEFFVWQFAQNGTTTIEAKSGYGGDLNNEIKILEIINELNGSPLDIVSTFLGAHSVPPEFTKKEYVEYIVKEMLPAVAQRKLAKFCDVFTEKGYFDVEDSRRILEEAKRLGFELKMHTNQFNDIGGLEVAFELKCRSVDHLEVISEEEIVRLSSSNIAAVLLPGFSFFSDYPYAPARKLIEKGAIVALGSDFNPGSSPTTSLPLIMSLACIKMKMLPIETLAATTINAAFSIGIEKISGSLEVGKNADITIWHTKSINDIPYFFGANLVRTVIKNGKIIKN